MKLAGAPLLDDDTPALVADDGVSSWRTLAQEVARRTPAFAGARFVVLQAATSKGLLLDLLAAGAAGAVPVLVPPRFPPARVAAARAMVDAMVDASNATANTNVPRALKDAADVTFTSGTLAAPRAVLHTRSGHEASARGANAHIPFGPGHRWLLSLPLCHVGGLGVVARAIVGGGAMVLPHPEEALADAIVRLDVTHVSLVRAQLGDLLRSPSFEAARARLVAVLVGGGPTPKELLAEAAQRGLPVAQTWGMTETHAQIATAHPARPDVRALADDALTCGRALPGREVRVDDDGQLWVRGAVLAPGTLTEGGLVPLPLVDGWFATGDRGRLDDAGHVIVSGRVGNRIVSGGEKIEPEAIEAALLGHRDVVDAVVVAVAHPRWGQRPVAFVRTRAAVAPAALAALVHAQLPAVHVPDAFLPWPSELPEGKPDRTALRLRAEEMMR